MTQQAREEGRTEGVGDLADPHPLNKEGATGETEELCGDLWHAGDPGAIFSQRVIFSQNKI